MPEESPELRVSDEDRDRAASEIREHFAAGRLDDEELSDRLAAIYRARTNQELERLRHDLPLLPASERAALAERRHHLQRQLIQQTGGSLGLFAICTVVWIAGGATGMFWPIWIALVALLPLLRNGWRLYGPAPELDRVEEELKRRRRRSHDERRALAGDYQRDRDERRRARREERRERRGR